MVCFLPGESICLLEDCAGGMVEGRKHEDIY
jgi:hypothetical protein